jgi:hypothetical protein
MSPDLSPLIFIAAMIALGCTLLGGLYLLFRDELTPDKKAPKKIIVSNVK